MVLETVRPPLKSPRQARSRRTLERVLDVTEELLEERRFEDITVVEIVRAAGTSVGAFYSRFRDKDALLPVLYERYDRWIGERARRAAAARPWGADSLAGIAMWLVDELVEIFGHRRFLMRAMTLHARSHPEKIDAETRARRLRQMSFLREALLSRRAEITHPDPERAVDFAIFMASTACRELILFDDAPHAASTPLAKGELQEEVVRQMLGYLGAETNPRAGHATAEGDRA